MIVFEWLRYMSNLSWQSFTHCNISSLGSLKKGAGMSWWAAMLSSRGSLGTQKVCVSTSPSSFIISMPTYKMARLSSLCFPIMTPFLLLLQSCSLLFSFFFTPLISPYPSLSYPLLSSPPTLPSLLHSSPLPCLSSSFNTTAGLLVKPPFFISPPRLPRQSTSSSSSSSSSSVCGKPSSELLNWTHN